MKDIAVFLCNLTLNAAQPWLDGGYTVVMVDPQHPKGIHRNGKIIRVGKTVRGSYAFLGKLIRSGRVGFVAGFPPASYTHLTLPTDPYV